METVIVNGTPYVILAERPDGTLTIARPNGIKQYRARRLPDSPRYGEDRAVIIPAGLGGEEEG